MKTTLWITAPIILTAITLGTMRREAHFECAYNTGNNSHAIIADSTAGFFKDGDIVAVFAGDDCVGQQIVHTGKAFAVTVWGDDSITPEIDGAVTGDLLAMSVYGARRLALQTDIPFVYAEDALYVLENVGFTPGSAIDSEALTEALAASRDSTLLWENKAEEYRAERNVFRNQLVVADAKNGELTTRLAKADSVISIVREAVK